MRRCLNVVLVLISCLALGGGLAAEDLPLGVVMTVDGKKLTLSFDQDSGLLPDDMVAVYGPGKVEKHPLTKEVIVEQRAMVAKAHVLQAKGGRQLLAAVTWQAKGIELAPGFDVVPLPGEASPDAPPVATAELSAITAQAQSTVRISLPIADPEGHGLGFEWALQGPTGSCGRLSARTTARPEVWWTAPTTVTEEISLHIKARDVAGQSQEWTVPLKVQELGDAWRQRQQAVFGAMGRDGEVQWLDRGPDGQWWAINSDRKVMRISAGWDSQQALAVQDGVRLSGPSALVKRGDELFVLDGRGRSVLVLARDGVLRRQMTGFSAPSDLAIAADGAVYVADQEAGGIIVYEKDGRYRCRLGYADREADDGFVGLSRLVIGPDGNCYALDSEAGRIHVFDRFHRRQAIWRLQAKEDNAPVDIAWHRQGLLVLLAKGQIQVVNKSGDATRAWEPLADKGWFERLYEASSIAVDASGEVMVTYPRDGLVVRYAATGKITGVRGAELWELKSFVADGQGRLVGLNERSGQLSLFDTEGWLLGRFGGLERYDGPFERPGAMAVSADGSLLCVIDTSRDCVIRFRLDKISERPLVFGQPGTNNGQFKEPKALAMDGQGRVYVVDYYLHRVSVFEAESGNFLFQFGRYERGRGKDELSRPENIAVNADGSMVYVYDTRTYEVKKFTIDHAAGTATHVTNGGGRGRDLGQFSRLAAMGCDRFGLLYTVDSSNKRLQVLDFRGNNAVALLAVTGEDMGERYPEGMALAPDGQVWVSGDSGVTGLRWAAPKP